MKALRSVSYCVSTLLVLCALSQAANFNLNEFLSVSFTHHMEILNKTATAEERFFYIHQTFIHQWDKYLLRDFLRFRFIFQQIQDFFLYHLYFKTCGQKNIHFPKISLQNVDVALKSDPGF